jgi:hypothetical protein
MDQEHSSTSREWDRLARGAILALGSALHGGTLAIRDGGTHVLGHGGEGTATWCEIKRGCFSAFPGAAASIMDGRRADRSTDGDADGA